MNKYLPKIYFLFLLVFPSLFYAQEVPPEVGKIYDSALKMRVEIYRIARDKVYEYYYTDFELIHTDLAEAIGNLEDEIARIQSFEGDSESILYLNQAVDVWNNLRFHSMKKLEKKDLVRFYYDTQTFDNFLKIMISKMEDKYAFNGNHWQDLKRKAQLQMELFKINTGYLAKKNHLSKSMENIVEKNTPVVESLFTYAKKRGYFSGDDNTGILVNILNDWLLVKYNFSNVFFSADRAIFALTNSIYKRTNLIKV